MTDNDGWDFDDPFRIEIDVADAHIDWLNHVNNAVYLQFLEQVAWRHTDALGLNWQAYERLDAACVVRRHEIDYIRPAQRGDRLQVATWILENDGRLAMWRASQIRRAADGLTLLRARSQFVCIRMSSGRPQRMPQSFVDAYRPLIEGER